MGLKRIFDLVDIDHTLDFSRRGLMILFTLVLGLLWILMYAMSSNYGYLLNPYFIYLHFAETIVFGLLLSKSLEGRLNISSKKVFSISILVLMVSASVFLFEKSKFGSVPLIALIGFVSGFSVSTGYSLKERFQLENEIDWKWLILCFFIAAVLRVLVFSIPEVPYGYDTPNYLLLSLESSKKSLSELIITGFSFSGDVYRDTRNFSMFWLGIFAKGLLKLGLDPILISKLIMPLIGSLSIFPFYLIAKEVLGSKEANFAALFFAFLPSEVLFCDLYKEILGELFVLLSLYFLVSLFNRKGLNNVVLLILSAFLLWKVAVTAFTKFFMFGIVTLVFYRNRLNLGIDKLLILILVLAAFPILFLPHILHFELSPVKPGVTDPYTRYSLPIILLTDISASIFAVYALLRDKNRIQYPFAILLSIVIFSGVISGLMGYRIFPSSNYLNTFRFSLYAGIPLSMLAGIGLLRLVEDINKRGVTNSLNSVNPINSRLSKIVILSVAFLLIFDFSLATSPSTTIHTPSRLYSYLTSEDFEKLNKIDVNKSVYLVGDYSWSPDSKRFSAANWIKYMVTYKTGKPPKEVDSMDQVPNGAIAITYTESRGVEIVLN
ncbi:MAG: hypothetical protein H0Z28_11920 [Archaeoglobus sp.]|nr:hypothetical protein [Archaeoglobus sp.]